MTKLKVAVVDPSLFTPPYDEALCAALANNGAQVTLFARRLRDKESLDARTFRISQLFYSKSERMRSKYSWTRLLTLIKPIEHIFNMRTFIKTLKRLEPSVIHVQWFPVPLMDAFFVAKLQSVAPIVLTVHDTTPFHGNASSRLQLLGWKRLLRKMSHIVVHTRSSIDRLIEYKIDPDRIRKIPHGVLSFSEKRPANVPRRRTVTEPVKFLFFGHIKSYKGLDLLLDALRLLEEKGESNWELNIAGQPAVNVDELIGQVRALANRSGIAMTLRFLSDSEVHEAIESCDCVVFPYRDIDASGILMGVIPYGKTVVASNLPAFAEVIDDRVDGLLFESENANSLADTLQEVIAQPQRSELYGERLREKSESIYSWNQIAARTLELYREAIEMQGCN